MNETPYIVSGTDTMLGKEMEKYPGGIVIPVDKPYRWTSADVIRKIKFSACRHFGKKNLKVGHAGTLDPLATGILIVCIGNATKIAEELQSHDKEYIAGISFGATTPSYDLEKDVDRMFPYGHITEESIRRALMQFIGEQEQIAPLFSAKSVDGVRAYELARKLYKKNIQSPETPDVSLDNAAESLLRTSIINITEAELLSFTPGKDSVTAGNKESEAKAAEEVPKASGRINVADTSHLGLPHADIRLACSKGTYVRAFARDLGEALGSGAHLDSLRRTRSGYFTIDDSVSLERALSLLQ